MDPFYYQFPRIVVGNVYLLAGMLQEAEDVLQSSLSFCEKNDIGQLTELAYLFLASTLIAKGHMKQGLSMLEEAQQVLIRNQREFWYAQSEYIFGKVYSQFATGPKPAFSVMTKNIGFLAKNVPFAGKKAEEHFARAIEMAKELGAKGLLGTANLDLGLFHKAKKKNDQAREYISEAIRIFEDCEAEIYLRQAKEALASLEG